MKMSEMRELGMADLAVKAKELSEELFKLKFQHTIRQLEDTSKLNTLKKQIARVKTVMVEKGGKNV